MGTVIKNAKIVNENKIIEGDLLIENQIITKIASTISSNNHKLIDLEGNFLKATILDKTLDLISKGP